MTVNTRPVLVTGGAGYVGGFAVRALLAAGEEVVVVDDLSCGHRETVPAGVPLVEVCLRDAAATREALRGVEFASVLHFAANAYVGESVRDPRKYWENNVGATLNLLGVCMDRHVREFVFSSTCAVYGEPPVESLREDLPRAPVNPYGRSKAVIEQVLEDYGVANGLRSFRLRYFNAAGAAEDGSLGEDHADEPHLIPLVLRATVTGRPLQVFGTDWPTPDGTCVRDYVHVEDLAAAHVAALRRLRDGHPGGALNLGTGRGTSVLEVIEAARRVTGRDVPWQAAPRRPGDPPFLVAAPGRAADVLGWKPRWTSIDRIVASAWAWHSRR
jgi:UDP-glucose-4-epimerase GalE